MDFELNVHAGEDGPRRLHDVEAAQPDVALPGQWQRVQDRGRDGEVAQRVRALSAERARLAMPATSAGRNPTYLHFPFIKYCWECLGGRVGGTLRILSGVEAFLQPGIFDALEVEPPYCDRQLSD